MGNGRMSWEKTENDWRRKTNITVFLALGSLVVVLVAMAMPEAFELPFCMVRSGHGVGG